MNTKRICADTGELMWREIANKRNERVCRCRIGKVVAKSVAKAGKAWKDAFDAAVSEPRVLDEYHRHFTKQYIDRFLVMGS